MTTAQLTVNIQNSQRTHKMETFYFIFSLFTTITITSSQIAYPEESPVGNSQNANNRQPVYIPGLCPKNQWYWPGNQETDWICDCASRFVYHPSTDMCHEVYRQGPCQTNEYLILLKGKIIPECVINPCANDTLVPFNGTCHRLYKRDACPTIGKIVETLNVNYTSLELVCLQRNAEELNNVIHVTTHTCLPGSKRSSSGQCRIIAG